MDRLGLRAPDDFHVHLRQAPLCDAFARDAAEAGFARVLAMPNLQPPLTQAEDVAAYKARLQGAAPGLTVLPTFMVVPGLDPATVPALKAAGAVAAKLYPEGATTNSEHGVAALKTVYPLIAALETEGLVLCLHGEDPHVFSLEREAAFLPQVRQLARDFPRLRIILEHVSSAAGAATVRDLAPQVAGTLTVHHLLYTLDDLLGAKLNPHLFCKPILKGWPDRLALIDAALSGESCWFYGSDSAPHLKETKEASFCSAGVYSMPVSLALLADFFIAKGRPERLEPFVSEHGARFYGLPLNEGRLVLERAPWTVPNDFHGVVPLQAGATLSWRLGVS